MKKNNTTFADYLRNALRRLNTKPLYLTAVAILGLSAATMAQNITNFATIWYNTFSANSGGFGRAIIDNNDLVISGANWPSWPSGTTDQMVTKISPSGNIIFQTVRAPGGDHDGYQAVVKLQNGNYGFFGQQNAQGTQYFDGFYTEFNSLGIEVSYNFFSIPGSSSGSDMLILPNGNRLYTGNHGGGLNYIALTDANFNQLSYQTFNVGGWNSAQLGIDAINNFVYAIGSESSTSSIQIVKYDMSLNYLSTYNITHTEPLLNYDIKMDGSDILLCGYKVIGGQRFGAFYRMNTNGVITDSFVSQNTSEYTAIEKYGNEIILAKSNLSGTSSISNELNIYQGSGLLGVAHSLNSSSPFVPFDLVLNGDTLYAVGVQGSGHSIGIPAVEKVLINANNCNNLTASATPAQPTCGLPNGTLTGSATGGNGTYAYLWSNGATTATVANLSAGTYTVTVTSAAGCTASSSATVNNSNCPKLNTQSTVNNITQNSASISWPAISCANKYRVVVKNVSTGVQTTTIVSAPNTSLNLSGLQPNTSYQVRIRTQCSQNGTVVSQLSPIRSFTTLNNQGIQCLPPMVSGITLSNTSVTINWTPALGAIQYNLRYRPAGTSTWVVVIIGNGISNSTTLQNLAPATAYEFQIRTKCNDNPEEFSPYSTLNVFNTLAQRIEEPSALSTLIYPNPTNSNINVVISATSETQTTIRITDLLGRVLLNETEELLSGNNTITYNISEYAAGVYLVHVGNGNTQQVYKVVKE